MNWRCPDVDISSSLQESDAGAERACVSHMSSKSISVSSRRVLEFKVPCTGGRDNIHIRSAPLSIISVGRDSGILRCREEAISSRSDLKVRSMDPEQAESWSRRVDPHLWIFCSTVELPRLAYLACSVRRYSPGSKLLLIEAGRQTGFERLLFQKVIGPAEGLETLLNAITDLSLAA
jgi:hypothetical protein